MADKVFLYWASGSPPCWRVMLALEEKGLSGYGNKLLKFDKQEHKSDEVLKWNPRGQLPTCVFYNSFAISESYAVLDYLEKMYPKQGTQLLPDDNVELAKVLQRKSEASNLEKRSGDLIHYKFPNKGDGSVDPVKAAKLLEDFLVELKHWEKYAGQGDYIAGNSFSLADLAVFPFFALLKRFGLDFDKHCPNIGKYYERVVKRPSVEKTWPPHWKENAPPANIFE